MKNNKPTTTKKPINDNLSKAVEFDRKKVMYAMGEIAYIYQDTNNHIHAVISKIPENLEDDTLTNSSGFFNNYLEGTNITNNSLYLAPMLVPIDNLLKNNYEPLDSYIGYKVKVKLVNEIAVSASVVPTPIVNFNLQRILKQNLQDSAKQITEVDLDKILQEINLTDLGKIDFSEKIDPVLVVANSVTTDMVVTDDQKVNKTVIKETGLLKSNNLMSKLKSALCHKPVKFLSGK